MLSIFILSCAEQNYAECLVYLILMECCYAQSHHGECHYADCRYAECHVYSIDMLIVIMLIAVMLSVTFILFIY